MGHLLFCVQQLNNSGIKFISSLCKNIVVYVVFRGSTALHTASKNGNVEAVNMLLKKASESQNRTINVNKSDNNSFTAVFYAIQASRYCERIFFFRKLYIFEQFV